MTTTTTHTPGPWKVSTTPYATVITAGSGLSIARMGGDSLEADDRLIAAAPDLLAALEEAINAMNAASFDFDHGDMMRAGRAAIAKARGE